MSNIGSYALTNSTGVPHGSPAAAAGAPEHDDIDSETIREEEESVSFLLSEHWSLICDGGLPGLRELALDW